MAHKCFAFCFLFAPNFTLFFKIISFYKNWADFICLRLMTGDIDQGSEIFSFKQFQKFLEVKFFVETYYAHK